MSIWSKGHKNADYGQTLTNESFTVLSQNAPSLFYIYHVF